jgi:hypothetical protein
MNIFKGIWGIVGAFWTAAFPGTAPGMKEAYRKDLEERLAQNKERLAAETDTDSEAEKARMVLRHYIALEQGLLDKLDGKPVDWSKVPQLPYPLPQEYGYLNRPGRQRRQQ